MTISFFLFIYLVTMEPDKNGNYSGKGILSISPNESIFDMLYLLRRPQMYLSSISIVALSDFMNAYLTLSSYAVHDQWEKFSIWLRTKKFPDKENEWGYYRAFQFYKIYRNLCDGNDEKAFALFMEHVEEYKKEFGITAGKYVE
jgi:hypothetical protein